MDTSNTQTNGRERTCTECGRRIPPERLRLLPATWTCVRCSGEAKKVEADTDIALDDRRDPP